MRRTREADQMKRHRESAIAATSVVRQMTVG
jgi:hypothetical protein